MAKARLLAKSAAEIYDEEILKDSPTCSKEALRIIVALIARKMEVECHWYQNCFFARRRNW